MRPATTSTSRFVKALRDEVDGADRSRLITGMAEALTARPLPAVTVEDVATRAGVSRAVFFQHFADVQDCFLATYEACSDLLRAQTTAAVVGGAGLPYDERIALGVRAYLETLASEPGLARAFLRDVTAAGPEALRRRRAVLRRFAASLRSQVDAAVAAGAPGRPISPVTALALAGAIHELVLEALEAGRGAELPALEDEIADLVAAAVLGPR
jgi:AcrR family transcriptional regulator